MVNGGFFASYYQSPGKAALRTLVAGVVGTSKGASMGPSHPGSFSVRLD